MLAGVHWLRRYRLQSRAKWRPPSTAGLQTRCVQRLWRGAKEIAWLKRVVARKARSNDVCLALKERVCVEGGGWGVEDTGFGTEMMGEGRERPWYPWLLSSLRWGSLYVILLRIFVSLALSYLSPLLYLYISLSVSYPCLTICRFYCHLSVTPAASLIFLSGLGPRLVNWNSVCWRPCIWSSLGVKLRKLDFLLRSQKYDSPFPLAPRSPFHPSASARPPRDCAQTFIPPCEYIRPPSLHVSNLCVCVSLLALLFFLFPFP